MKRTRPSTLSAVLLVGFLTCDGQPLPEQSSANSTSLIPEQLRTVLLNSYSEGAFVVALDSLRTRFCARDGRGPCYDYDLLYAQIDNCGVTAFPLREIVYFENKGDFSPNYCISATQSSVLTTEKEQDRNVYLQEQFWSIVGTEVGTGETVELALGDVASFEQYQTSGS